MSLAEGGKFVLTGGLMRVHDVACAKKGKSRARTCERSLLDKMYGAQFVKVLTLNLFGGLPIRERCDWGEVVTVWSVWTRKTTIQWISLRVLVDKHQSRLLSYFVELLFFLFFLLSFFLQWIIRY